VKADETRFHDADVRNATERLRAKIGDLPIAIVTATAAGDRTSPPEPAQRERERASSGLNFPRGVAI
jgi:hypothetical protein